jgi:hypothetical protein
MDISTNIMYISIMGKHSNQKEFSGPITYKECHQCKKEKPIYRFDTFRTRTGDLRRRGVCYECRHERDNQQSESAKEYRKEYNKRNRTKREQRNLDRRKKLKDLVNKAKDVPCADCGAKWPPVAMDFDHVHGIKEYGIAHLVSGCYREELLLEEMKKCEVVCACCHRLRTYNRDEHFSPGTPRRPRQMPM